MGRGYLPVKSYYEVKDHLVKELREKHNHHRAEDVYRDDETLEQIYSYWKEAREKIKKPLLRIFQPKTDLEDQDCNKVFRKRNAEKMKLRKKAENDTF